MKIKSIFFTAIIFGFVLSFISCNDDKETDDPNDNTLTVYVITNILTDVEFALEENGDKTTIENDIKAKMRPVGTAYYLYNTGKVTISEQDSENEVNANFTFETIIDVLYLNIEYSDGTTETYRTSDGKYLIRDFTQFYKQSYPNLTKAEGLEQFTILR